jgi:hypothetical protein
VLAEFDVDLGEDSPTLVVPWASDDGTLAFIDLAQNPSLLDEIPETRDPALRRALAALNAADLPWATAKCDLWTTQELDEEEELFGADWKHASYLDIYLRNPEGQMDFATAEQQMRKWVQHLRRIPVEPASAAIILRACAIRESPGFYWTLYVSGFGDTGIIAHSAWAEALDASVKALLKADG